MYTPIKNIPTESSLPLKGIEHPGTGRASTLIVSTVLVIGILGILTVLSFRLFPETTNRLSALLVTLFSREEKIEIVTNPSTINTNEIFTLFYEHSGRNTAGSYVLTYPCSAKTGLYFSAEENLSTDKKTLTCDQNIDIAPKDKESYGSLFLVATKTDSEELSTLPITIAFIPEGTTTPLVRGTATVIVENIQQPISTPTTSPNKTTPTKPITITQPQPKPNTQNITNTSDKNEIVVGPVHTNTYEIASGTPKQNGRPDLAVRIIETGIVDKTTGAFTATSSFKSSDRIAVKFEIRNDGGREMPSWYFNAVLPTFPSHIFTSESQQSLVPGARIEYTLGFDNVSMTAPTREFVVNADPANSIGEANETNNIARASIDPITP